jgi:phosphatidate cytidylyltransferase
MSPQHALHNFTFCFYAIAAAIMLLFAGAVLVVIRRAKPLALQHAWQAYLGWLVIVPVVLGAVFLGRACAIALFTFMAILGFKEYARATGLYRNWPMVSVVFTGILAIGVVCWVDDPFLHTSGWYGLFVAMPVFVIAAIIMIPIILNRSKGQLQAMALAILGFIYIGWMFGHLSFLANARHAYGYLLYLMFAVALNDVAAYTCGKLLGRHKLRSEISPNKTWEGSLGALAFSMALPWALRFSLPEFGPRELILTGLIVGLGGQIGDLSISVIKRDVGVKDMGKVLQGHGGILDRIDSLIYTAPLFFHMAGYFHSLQ